jgi:outer membrane protein OmpA-like peptidoglycan-associated protein
MKGALLGNLLLAFGLLGALLLSGCAAPKSMSATPSSMIVLLPEGGKVSGEVTVANANGSQLLNQSWQSVEISGSQGRPTDPVVLEDHAVQDAFAPVRRAMPERPVHYLLYFKLNSAEILPESKLLLPKIVAEIKQRRPAQLSVVGHADALGSVEYNYRLGQARAAEVVQQLALQGAAPAGIETFSRGKGDPLVKTPDQTPEPRNRRAEVTIR